MTKLSPLRLRNTQGLNVKSSKLLPARPTNESQVNIIAEEPSTQTWANAVPGDNSISIHGEETVETEKNN